MLYGKRYILFGPAALVAIMSLCIAGERTTPGPTTARKEHKGARKVLEARLSLVGPKDAPVPSVRCSVVVPGGKTFTYRPAFDRRSRAWIFQIPFAYAKVVNTFVPDHVGGANGRRRYRCFKTIFWEHGGWVAAGVMQNPIPLGVVRLIEEKAVKISVNKGGKIVWQWAGDRRARLYLLEGQLVGGNVPMSLFVCSTKATTFEMPRIKFAEIIGLRRTGLFAEEPPPAMETVSQVPGGKLESARFVVRASVTGVDDSGSVVCFARSAPVKHVISDRRELQACLPRKVKREILMPAPLPGPGKGQPVQHKPVGAQ